MRHFIGRVDIASGNVKILKELESPEEVRDSIRSINRENDRICKENSDLKIAKSKLPSNIPHYNPEIHGSLNQYIKLKKKLKNEYQASLSPEELKLYHEPYAERAIPFGTKLVYVAVHDLEEIR